MAQSKNFELTPLAQVVDYHLSNQPGFDFRTELNTILAALVSNNSGSTPPTTPTVGMFWLDTSKPVFVLMRRNSTNSGWIKVFDEDNAPTKSQVGLSNVDNYSSTDSLTDGSDKKFATAKATKALQDNKLGRLSQAADSAKLGGIDASDYALKNGDYNLLRARATTKEDVGLGSVKNYGISDSTSLNSSSTYASAKAINTLNESKLGRGDKAEDSDLLDGRDSTSFADAIHNHSIDEVTGLTTALDGKLGNLEKAASALSADRWTTPRTFTLKGHSVGSFTIDGSKNAEFEVNNTFALDSTYAQKLKSKRTISIQGAVSGSGEFDGSSNLVIKTELEYQVPTVPIGGIVMWPGTKPPSGFLECNGATVNRTTYPVLHSILNTGDNPGKVPDMRGVFARGWDNGRGQDSTASRKIKTYQADDNKRHDHSGNTNNGGGHQHNIGKTSTSAGTWAKWNASTGSFGVHSKGGYANKTIYTASVGNHSHSYRTTTQGTESRPKNVALMYIIRAI